MIDLNGNKGKILGILYSAPGREYYMQELGRLLGKKPGVFQKALESLLKDGSLKSEYRANSRYFCANESYPLYGELKSIIKKTAGIIPSIKDIIVNAPGIEFAFVYGSFAKGAEHTDSDIDVFLIGEAVESVLLKEIEKLEIKFKREINYRLMPKNEMLSAIKEKDPFILSLISDKINMLKGGEDEFRKLFNAKPGKKGRA